MLQNKENAIFPFLDIWYIKFSISDYHQDTFAQPSHDKSLSEELLPGEEFMGWLTL